MAGRHISIPILFVLAWISLGIVSCLENEDHDRQLDGDNDSETVESLESDVISCNYPNDETLRYNHIQGKGTHNSYHIQRETGSHPEHLYTHQPLAVQLDMGIRQFELDIHKVEGEPLRVYHIPMVDEESTCRYLVDCLTEMKTWSEAHPCHLPPLVLLEMSNMVMVNPQELTWEEVEQDILSVFERNDLLTPDDVRKNHTTLKEAIETDGWPNLGEIRGKFLLHAHTRGDFRTRYLEAFPELAGALMFTDSGPGDSFAAVMPMNDPTSEQDEIREAVEAGFVVRTRADVCCDQALNNDTSRLEDAIRSGAQFISTDFPAPVENQDYWVDIPDADPLRCNPLTAPETCTSGDLE